MVPGSAQYNQYLENALPYLSNEFSYGMGAIYSDGLVYVGIVPARLGGTVGGQVRVLDPTTFTWSELPNTGMRPIVLAGAPATSSRVQWGNWQRFNIVEWPNAKVLIHAADSYGPTHAWRIR
jgi:hypothetical protein